MEIIVKINSNPGDLSYKDGDIVEAFSMDRIHRCHAQQKCSVKNFPLQGVSDLRPSYPLLIKYKEKTSLYKFERINSNEILRTNLITQDQDIIGTTPNARGEYIHPYSFIANRKKNILHSIFGTSGNEFWYGGVRADANLNDIWNDIETHTNFLKSEHSSWPLSPIERRIFLPMNCCTHLCEDEHHHEDDHSCLNCTCDCSLTECSSATAVEKKMQAFTIQNEGTDQEKAIVFAKRKFQIPYWDFSSSLSINVDHVRDTTREVSVIKDLSERPSVDVLTVDKVAAGIIRP